MHPWTPSSEWENYGPEYYNVTQTDPGWPNYVSTVFAYYHNSMGVPSYASFAILAGFTSVVAIAAALRLAHALLHFSGCSPSSRRFVPLLSKHIGSAPLVGKRHSQTFELMGQYLTLKVPLRGETFLLVALLIANIVPIAAFYTPFQPNNYYWEGSWEEMGRYLADRTGILATAQLVPLFLLSGRNNAVSFATGASFETCMLYHRWFARLVFLQTMIHALGYTIIVVGPYGAAEWHEYFKDPYLVWGTVATVTMGWLTFMSLRWLRQKAYEFFVLLHVIFGVVTLVGIYYHIELLNEDGSYADFVDYVWAAIAFYCVDKAARWARVMYYNICPRSLSVSTVSVNTVYQGATGAVLRHRIMLKGLGKRHANTAPGHYVQLWIPRLQPLSSHPFTVAACDTDLNLYLYTRVYDGVTKRLHSREQENYYALAEGFYGHVEEAAAYDAHLFAAGGIGITSCLPQFLQAHQKTRHAHLVWIIPDADLLAIAAEILSFAAPDEKPTPSIEGNEASETKHSRISIYVTRKDPAQQADAEQGSHVVATNVLSDVPELCNADNQSDKVDKAEEVALDAAEQSKERVSAAGQGEITAAADALGIDATVRYLTSRPDLTIVLADAVENIGSAQLYPRSRILACGPAAFCDDARSVARKFGLNYEEEAFEW